MAESSAPIFKSFVSEKEIEDVKKKRQEEWERVRKPEDPIGRSTQCVDHSREWFTHCAIFM